MAVFKAEDMRLILDRLDEYITTVTEKEEANDDQDEKPDDKDQDLNGSDDEDTKDSIDSEEKTSDEADPEIDPSKDKEEADGESTDELMTKPAGLEKLVGSLNPDVLIQTFGIEEEDAPAFRSAITALRSEEPKLTREQAMALATAFDHVLTQGYQKKDQLTNILRPVHGAMNEDSQGYNPNFNDEIGAKELGRMMQQASGMGANVSGVAKSLADVIRAGQAGRNLDDGLEGIYNAVVFTIKLASTGDRSALLHMLDDFESKYEGDHYAFDPEKWPMLVSGLKRLGREILASLSKK